MPPKHLQEKDFMRLLQFISQPVGRFKKSEFDFTGRFDDEMNHLLDCPYCLKDLWQCYLSFETLAQTGAQEKQASLALKLAPGTKLFSIGQLAGLLLPLELKPAPAVRSGTIADSLLSAASYVTVLTGLPGATFQIRLKASSVAVEVAIRIRQLKRVVELVELHQVIDKKTEKLIESQSVASLKETCIFMLPEKTAGYQFSLKTNTGENLSLLTLKI